MKRMSRQWLAAAAALLLIAVVGRPAHAEGDGAEALLAEHCGMCHQADQAGHFSRISFERKTPEGWMLTLSRMERWHGVTLSDAEEASLVKWLADHQGLAPDEAAPYRYALELRPVTENPDDADLAGMCAVCHTYARFALERRDQAEWTKLAHMHLGQWPSVEYVGGLRGREWWKQASTELPAKLAGKFPFASPSWDAWSRRAPVDLAGTWVIAGRRPGKGDYAGRLVVTRTGPDHYALQYEVRYADASKVTGGGESIVYTGYEWRGSVHLGKERQRQVLAVSTDGNRLSGRWFLDGQDTVGGDLTAVRGQGVIAAVQPPYLQAGRTARLTIVGSNLQGPVDLGPGATIRKVVAGPPGTLTVTVQAGRDAALGLRALTVGSSRVENGLVVYDRVASVAVEPAMAVARVGGNGGPIASVLAQFEAVGFMKGPGGDAIRIGPMPAKWTVGNFDRIAEQAHDARFGGRMQQDGLFVPAAAGPNPRRGGYNNAANLMVKAEVKDGSEAVAGTAHLVVAPQRWNDAPIR